MSTSRREPLSELPNPPHKKRGRDQDSRTQGQKRTKTQAPSHQATLSFPKAQGLSGPPPQARPTIPPTTFDVEGCLLELLDTLHQMNPGHPMFGPPAPGLIRLPMMVARANGQSWTNALKRVTGWIREAMGASLTKETCWMSKQTQLQITITGANSKPMVLR